MKRGFTLLELILTITIILILIVVIEPAWLNQKGRSDINLATMTIAQRLRRASLQASASDTDDAWGVKVVAGQVIVFEGASYSGRVTTRDEVTTIDEALTIGGTSEFVFTRFTGLPMSTGSLTLTDKNGTVKTVTVNSKAMVEYD